MQLSKHFTLREMTNSMTAAPSFIGNQRVTLPNAVTEANTYASLYPGDTLGNLYNQKQIKKS